MSKIAAILHTDMKQKLKTYHNAQSIKSRNNSIYRPVDYSIQKLGDFYYDRNGLIRIFNETANNKIGIVLNQKV